MIGTEPGGIVVVRFAERRQGAQADGRLRADPQALSGELFGLSPNNSPFGSRAGAGRVEWGHASSAPPSRCTPRRCWRSSPRAPSRAWRRSTARPTAAASAPARAGRGGARARRRRPALAARARRPARRGRGGAAVRRRCSTRTPTPAPSTPRSAPTRCCASSSPRAPGRRVPGCVDPAEIAVRAVLGQQVSVAAARTQAARLTERCGEPPAASPSAASRTCSRRRPRSPSSTRRRCRCRAPAAARWSRWPPRWRTGSTRATAPPSSRLRGIGPWTADYVAMRCGDPDVLLETDLGVRRGFARLGDPAALVRRAERWRPWRSYAVQHLWSLA